MLAYCNIQYSHSSVLKHILCYRTLLIHTDASVLLGLRATSVKQTAMTVCQILVGMEQHVL